ncbi:MAG: terminase small subunit protein [SAR202 cluster bacterium]|nr:terminase small subunit protein [SAR202 cluster bacterium]
MMTKPIRDRPLKRAGRKSEYKEEIALEICVRLIEGQTLREICEAPEMPGESTVYRWLAVQPTFRSAYARAAQMDTWADEIVEIADDASEDYVDREAADGSIERVFDAEKVQRAKLRIDTRKWLMSKLAARRYGDKVEVEVSGNLDVKDLSDAELEARTRAALAAMGVQVPDTPLLLGPTQPSLDDDALPPPGA